MKKKDLKKLLEQYIDIQKRCEEIQNEINILTNNQNWLSSHMIELNAIQKSQQTQSGLLKIQENLQFNVGDETVIKGWMLIPETDYNFTIQLLAECDDLVRWWLGKLNLKFADDSFYDVFYKAFKIAFLWEPIVFYSGEGEHKGEHISPSVTPLEDNKSKEESLKPESKENPNENTQEEKKPQEEPKNAIKWGVYRLHKIENDKMFIYPCEENDEYETYYKNKEVLDKDKIIEINKDQGFILNLWHHGVVKIGMFIRLIQGGLQNKIYLDRIRSKNESFLQVICDTSTVGRSKPSWITRFFSFFVRDKSQDNQTINKKDSKGQSTALNKVKWFSPEQHEKTYQVLNDAIEKEYEKVCQIVGKDITPADKKQTLSTEANTFGESYLCIQNFVMTQVFRCLDKMNIQYETWTFEQQEEQKTPDNLMNDNASGGDEMIKQNKEEVK